MLAPSPTRPRSESPLFDREPSGFSLIEVLIAAALLLIVSVGILPMFTRSITNNLQGKQATEATNLARSELERMIQLPANDPALTLIAGNELVRNEKWSKDSKRWYDVSSFPSTEIDTFERTVTVRQFSMNALADGVLDASELLDASADPQAVHLKEIEVQVGAPPSGMSPGKQVTLRMYKAL
ncbi:MAG: prepilin-type N-terminal cleavage/methylation domain-containing protein [Acidobacteriota bacterium]